MRFAPQVVEPRLRHALVNRTVASEFDAEPLPLNDHAADRPFAGPPFV